MDDHRQRCRTSPEHHGDGERNHGINGTAPAAFVTLKAGHEASADLERAIHERVVANISKIAVPERVIFTEVMPKTPSGKIMRRLLTEIVAAGGASSDVTALEDRTAVDRLKALVMAAQGRASTAG